MALTEQEKEHVLEKIGELEYTARRLVLASLEAFSEWCQKTLYNVYVKIKDGLKRLWQWIADQFS